jgi:hypothetical protein
MNFLESYEYSVYVTYFNEHNCETKFMLKQIEQEALSV